MDVRARIRRGAQIMYTVAVSAHRDFDVTLRPLHAVYAGLVLLELIDPQPGVVFFHPFGIGVAGSAELRNLLALDLALPSGSAAHGLFRIVVAGITTVTGSAGEALLSVYVLAVGFDANAQRLRRPEP